MRSNLISRFEKLWVGQWSIYGLAAPNSPFITCSEQRKMGLGIHFSLLPVSTILSSVSGVHCRDITGRKTFPSWFWCAFSRNLLRDRFPQHRSRWISSKFYKHSVTATFLPLDGAVASHPLSIKEQGGCSFLVLYFEPMVSGCHSSFPSFPNNSLHWLDSPH